MMEPCHPGRLSFDCGGDPSRHCPLTADYDATLRGRDLPPEDNSDSRELGNADFSPLSCSEDRAMGIKPCPVAMEAAGCIVGGSEHSLPSLLNLATSLFTAFALNRQTDCETTRANSLIFCTRNP